MARIFVSYRRSDAASEAGRIKDWLDNRFGEDEVFMDITTLEPGADFVAAIEDAVNTIDALIAVIGPNWIGASDPQGNRRLDEPHDYVRLEIGNALRRRIRVIPVLVEGAQMPRELELPEDLQPLVRRNALELTLNQWRAGIDRLTQALDGIVTPPPPPPPSKRGVDFGALPFLVLVAAALLLSGIFVKSSHHESFLRPSFGGATNFHNSTALWRSAGFFTSLATVGFVAVSLAGARLIRDERRQQLGTGLLLAAVIQGPALYARVLSSTTGHKPGFAVALLGGAGITAAGVFCLVKLLPDRDAHVGSSFTGVAITACLVSATATLIGMIVNFNRGGASQQFAGSVFDGEHVELWALLVTVVLVAATPFVAPRLRIPQQISAGLLVGLGIGSLCIWPRFIAIPLMENHEIASLGAGGVIGLIGAAAILFGGLRAREPVGEPLMAVSAQ